MGVLKFAFQSSLTKITSRSAENPGTYAPRVAFIRTPLVPLPQPCTNVTSAFMPRFSRGYS